MNENGYTLADIAAVTGSNNGNRSNDGMFGNGDWGAWIILFLIFGLFGGWGGYGGWGGGNGSGGAMATEGYTKSYITEGFAMNNLQSGINAIQQGICDATYALNNTVNNGFHGVDQGLCGLSAQLAQCCCDNKAAIADVKYQMATDTCAIQNTVQSTTRDIMENNNANTRSILDFLVQDKISTLSAENAALKTQIGISNQNAFITANQEAQTAEILRRIAPLPVPAYTVPNPNCCYGANNFCNSCC